MITHAFTEGERIPLITAIFSDTNQAKAVRKLSRNDAQLFVDEVDKASSHAVSHSWKSIDLGSILHFPKQVLDDLEPQIRRECLQSLSKICSRQTLLPSALQLPRLYDPMENPVERDDFADLWKGQYTIASAQIMQM